MAWTTPITFSAGATLTAAQLNTGLRDNLNAAFPGGTTWAAWAPTYANLTIGNGTVVARYIQVGSVVIARWQFTLGSTSAVGSGPTISFPVTAASTGYTAAGSPLGQATFVDTGVGRYYGVATYQSTTTFSPTSQDVATYVRQAAVSATAPFTWVSTDIMMIQVVYEAA